MKSKRYEKGGDVSGFEDQLPNEYKKETVGGGFNRSYDSPTPDDAEFMASEVSSTGKASKPKKDRIVSKKELEASGLSLRDFLNREKGLDRKQPENWKKRGFAGSETGGDAAVMYRKSMASGGKAYAKGGSVKASAMGSVPAGGKRPHGEHSIQLKGHTRALMPKMGK